VSPTAAAGQLGAGFSQAFAAGAFTDPLDPDAGDIVDVDAKADPIDITNP
jgi:hypothetical protein